MLALTAALAIVVQDRAALRTAAQADAPQLATLWQGDLLEVRGEHAGYLRVYDYRRERGGYLKGEAARAIGVAAGDAPEELAVVRFLRDSPGSEALGISYGAAYLKASSQHALSAEPLTAIGLMAERLADRASGGGDRGGTVAAHLEVVEQFGVRMRTFEHHGRLQVCYDGEMYRRVLALPSASPEERALAALGLTRPDCIDPDLNPLLRAALDDERRALLEAVAAEPLTAMTRSRLRARRAAVWATVAFEQARSGKPTAAAAQRALAELAGVRSEDLGDGHRTEYLDAVLRVGAIRWAAAAEVPQTPPLTLTASRGDPGQTCVELSLAHGPSGTPAVRRCTYGIVWLASSQSIAQGRALVLAVQPLEGWRELWVFHVSAGAWTVDVVSPGTDEPEEGYVDFAGFAPATDRLLIAREVQERGQFRRRFEELRLDDLTLVRGASTPDLLRDFGSWQDSAWRRDTLALH
jgi:hypothetical protein